MTGVQTCALPICERNILPGKGKPRDESLQEDYRKLIAIRKAHPSLSRGTHTALATDGDLLVFSQKAGNDEVIVAVNRGAAAAEATVPVPAHWVVGTVTDEWINEPLSVSDGKLKIPVKPKGARVIAWRE